MDEILKIKYHFTTFGTLFVIIKPERIRIKIYSLMICNNLNTQLNGENTKYQKIITLV